MKKSRNQKVKASSPTHRGRFQAQGETLEESVAWSTSRAPSANEGNQMLVDLSDKIRKKEYAIRTRAFKDASNFINEALAAGGADAEVIKSFVVRNTLSERVDVEIRKGCAFKVRSHP